MMHIGPSETEPDTVKRIEAFMDNQGLVYNGLHHEIYICDPRKADPSVMKTILRFPVANRE
nr:GyrI-like domain-containing protein [Paenibacillus hemerocallicola]